MNVFIQTYGCQMNELDSGKMLRLLEQDGYASTDTVEQADLILINTCSVREKPEQKVRSLLGRYRELKDGRPDLVLGVTGCYAQQAKGELLKRFPWVDLVMGPDAVTRLPALVADIRERKSRRLATEQLARGDYPFATEPVFRDAHQVTAFVVIQKGCDNICSFCIVPTTRGREVSRASGEVVREVEQLVAGGVREVTLLGQNVNSYGLGRSDEPPFHELVERVAAVHGVERIRFTTSNPWDLSPHLVELFAREPKLCSYFHLPVQAGADSMLERMRRRHSIEAYHELVASLRAARPDIALSTDIICGYPGETEAEHRATLELLERVEYDFIYSFVYSERPGTPSARRHPDDVPRADKKRRLAEVQGLQREITRRRMEAWVGRTVPVLVEGISRNDDTWVSGRISQNWIVNLPGDASLVGQTVDVVIEEAFTNTLRGALPGDRPSGVKLQVLR